MKIRSFPYVVVKRPFAISCAMVFFLCSAGNVGLSAGEKVSRDAYVTSGIGDARVLIPLYADDVSSSGICNLVYSGLTKLDRDLNIVPDLALSWDIEDGGRVITFYLRPEVRWHDGEHFTAADVKFTYEVILDQDKACPYISAYSDISQIKIIDDHTVRFHYDEPYAPALSRFGMGIIPKHIFEEEPDIRGSTYARNPIGTGPYRFLSWASGQHIILESFKDYYEGPAGLDKYVYRVIPDQTVQFLELVSGGIDSMSLTPYQYFYRSRTAAIEKDIERHKYLSPSYTYLGYNLNDRILSDLRVRKALSYAIDKQGLIDGVLLGLGERCTGPFLKGTPYYSEDANDYSYDPEKARALLAEAGWEDESGEGILMKDGYPLNLTIATNQGNTVREQVATVIQAQWKQIGIDTEIKIVSWSAFLDQFIKKKNFQIVLLGWTIPPEPDPFTVWHSASSGEGGLNFVSYSNSDVDELIEQARREFNKEKRALLYREIHHRIAEDSPYTFLFYPYATIAVDKRIRGLEPALSGIKHNFVDWYVPENMVKYDFSEDGL